MISQTDTTRREFVPLLGRANGSILSGPPGRQIRPPDASAELGRDDSFIGRYIGQPCSSFQTYLQLGSFTVPLYILLPSPPDLFGGEGLGVRGPRCSIRSSIAVSIKHRTLAGSCVT